jgi:two-component system LytT family response regulator
MTDATSHVFAPIRTIVCDDEPDAREGLSSVLADDDEVSVLGEAKNGEEAVRLITELDPELVYLDVQMPKLDGFGVLHAIGHRELPVVVFVTAYDEYALRAFEVHALDYLLKPFSDERFLQAHRAAKRRVRLLQACALSGHVASLLGRATSTAGADLGPVTRQPRVARHTPTDPHPVYVDRIMVRVSRTVTVIRVEDIDWIEADDYYARVHTGGRSYLVRETMDELESKLDPAQFVRVHRSAIVRIDRVQTLQPYFKGTHVLVLKDGTRLTLSRGRKAHFERAIGGRM